jgi:glucose uptake protein
MFIIETYGLAVAFCFITMLAWGSWANTQKLAAKDWRFELFYWDYVFGIVLFALLFALTAGSIGPEGRPFWTDLMQADSSNLWSAFLGGILFNLANILLVAAITLAGMSVAFPVGIGLALVVGVIVNYLDAPVGDSKLLFAGVGMVVLAILLNANAYRKLTKVQQKVPTKGLILAVVAGLLMGLFYKYVANSMFSDFTVPVDGKLSPYTAVFIFALGILGSNLVFNTILMRKPFEGAPVSYRNYFQGSRKSHLMGILGGVIWCIGMSFSILASDKAGPAISYGLGQGATVVAALWGIFVWKEFIGAPKGVGGMLNAMLLIYIAGLTLIIAAR